MHRPARPVPPPASRYSRAQFEQLVEDALGARARSWARRDAGAEASEGAACRCRCARARSRTSSATATSRSASRSTSASAAATPAPRTFRAPRSSRRCSAAYDIARFTAEDPVAGLPDAADLPRRDEQPRPRPVPSLGHRRRGGGRAGAASARRAALRHRHAHHQLRRRRRVGAAIAFLRRQHAAAFAAAMPARAIRSRWRRSPARAATCSATTGTARCATAARAGRRRRRSAAMPRSARWRASKSRKIATREMPGAVRVAAGRRPARRASCRPMSGGALYRKTTLPGRLPGQAGASRSTCDIREDPHRAARQGQRAVRRRGRAHARRARWSTTAWCRAISCAAIRRASSA